MNILRFRWAVVVILTMLIVNIGLLSAQEESYTVQSGDTIQAIANRFEVSTDALLQYNGIIDPNRIFRGQVIKIPVGVVSPPQTHQVQPGETLRWIAERYNVTQESLIDANNLTNVSRLTVGQVLNLPATGGPSIFTQEHIVQTGQTLRSIGELYGISWEELASVNNLPNPNLLQVGQTLIVPAFGSTPVTTPVPQPVATQAPVVVATQAPPQQQAPQQTQLQTYVVQVGDNPALIADRFGVTLTSLIDINNLRGNLPIFAGDILLIPPTGGVTGTVTTTTATNNQTFTAPPGQYIVQPEDTLFEIAIRYNRNVYDIAAANGLLNLNSIYVGQILTIE